MDWQKRMERAIAYMERHLKKEVDMEKAAREANCSAYHFMRIFEVVTGLSPAEYLRRRRLSCAAVDLSVGKERILDIALRYGYDSPDSFTRAFKREFGLAPSEAKVAGAKLHNYPPLRFSIALKGDKAMEYRIEEGPEYRLTGLNLIVDGKDGQNFKVIPAFWETIMKDGRFSALAAVEAALSKSPAADNQSGAYGLGICAVCRDFDIKTGTFSYTIAVERPRDSSALPPDC